MIHMRIVAGSEIIADIPEWKGPIPSAGDYVFHPPQESQDVDRLSQIAGYVHTVTWRLYERGEDPSVFSATDHPYVEINLGPDHDHLLGSSL